MAQVFDGRVPTFGRLLTPVECLTYRICGIDRDTEMTRQEYTQAVLSLSDISVLAVRTGIFAKSTGDWVPELIER